MNAALRIVWAVLLLLAAGFVLLSLLDYSSDQIYGARPAAGNLMGVVGAALGHALILSWGLAALLVPVVMAGWAQALWRRYDLSDPARRVTGAILLLPAVAGLIHLLPVGATNPLLLRWSQTELGGLGGAVGRLLTGRDERAGLLSQALGVPGAAVLLTLVLLLAIWLMRLGVGRWFRRLGSALRSWWEPAVETDPESERLVNEAYVPPQPGTGSGKRKVTSVEELSRRLSDPDIPADAASLVERIRAHREALERKELPPTGSHPAPDEAIPASTEAAPTTPVPAAEQPLPQISDAQHNQPHADPPAPSPQPVASPTAQAPQPPSPRPSPAPPAHPGPFPYVLPSHDLLDAAPVRQEAQHEAEKNTTARAIEEVFGHFDIGVQVVAATRGPVVTQYEIRLLDQSLRVNKVEGFEKDLQMKLGTEGIRIVAPLPNKTTIGIEVPNKVKAMVSMRELVEAVDPSKQMLPLVLGRDAVGRPLIADLAKMPHLLVAGSTGMGKSVCMNAMICSLLLFRRPDEVKFIMVDPKMVELAGYEDIPHLLAPPITDMTKAHAALEWACTTMDERYEALKAAGVRDIAGFNALGDAELRFRLAKKEMKLEDLSHDSAFMPYIVVLVDEYADLMMVNKEVEKSIVRLAAKSRACGIHVILTTQRPSADVVTGLIKSNLPSRICFRVVDKNNSRVVLDVSGAENLLGKGDMLFLQPGTSLPVRAQGLMLKDSEIAAIVDHAKAQARPVYEDAVVDVGAVAQSGDGSGAKPGEAGGEWLGDRDFHAAVQAMYRYNRTGADFFRRKLNIGYNKATSYVERLEDLGFVGPQKGTAPREILKTWDDWIDTLKSQGATWEEGDDTYLNPVELRT
ncbi:hypothetical protein LBMAG53_01230 [Planctomycetota bacterium]|nr:hypothetical protein LBMAG53_01230 [Planctomycetota bacterium]